MLKENLNSELMNIGLFANAQIYLRILSTSDMVGRAYSAKGICSPFFYDLNQGFKNPCRQVDVMNRVLKVAHNIRGSSVWNLNHFIPLAPIMFRWLLDLRKICAPLVYIEIFNK